jgi:hypothetical protein
MNADICFWQIVVVHIFATKLTGIEKKIYEVKTD